MSMLSRLTLSILLFATLAMGDTAWAATYYVDRNLPGNDNNSGTTEGAPFRTIVKCVATADNPGDTCLVKNGTYPEAVTMRHSGRAGYPITLKNYPGHTPVLDFGDGTVPSQRFTVQATPVPTVIQYIVIEGLELTGGWEGIKLSTAENIIIRRNYIHHNGADNNGSSVGILCTYCYALTIDRNRIHHNGNYTQFTKPDGTTRPRGVGIYIYGTGHVITNNIITESGTAGIQASGYPFSSGGATAQRQAGLQAYIANNTIAYNWGLGLVFDQAEHHDSIVENNLFYQNAVNASVNGIRSGYGGGQGGHIIRNNHFYSTAPRGTISIDTVNSWSYTQTNNICDSGCSAVSTNPNMVNAPATIPASPNFHLKSPSQAIGFGLNRTGYDSPVSGLDFPTADHDGVVRPTSGAWEVGAYEFSSDTSAPTAPRNLQVN